MYSLFVLECVCQIIRLCHSEERSDEESHFQTQFRVANRDSSLLPVAQNDMSLFRIQTLGKQRRIVAYLDGLPLIGDLRQVKVNALQEWWWSRASAVLAHIETQSASREELRLPPLSFGHLPQIRR